MYVPCVLCGDAHAGHLNGRPRGDPVSPVAHFRDSARRGWAPGGVRDLDLFSHPDEAGQMHPEWRL